MNSRSTVAAVLAVSAATAIAAGCEQKPKTPLQRGAGIYLRSCSGCHGPTGKGVWRPGLSTQPKDLTDRTLQSSLTDRAMKETIRHGKGPMPAFGNLLGDGELDALVQFVRTLDDAAK